MRGVREAEERFDKGKTSSCLFFESFEQGEESDFKLQKTTVKGILLSETKMELV
jgi:hypothetical protein